MTDTDPPERTGLGLYGVGVKSVLATNMLSVGVDLTPLEQRVAARLYGPTSQVALAPFSCPRCGEDPLTDTNCALCGGDPAVGYVTALQLAGGLRRGRESEGEEARSAKDRLRQTVDALRNASSENAQTLVAEFLAALAELLAYRVSYARRSLLMLLAAIPRPPQDCPVWIPTPIDTSPRVTPRGPNFAFPVSNHRGGHYRSTLGSVVLAA